MAECIVSRAKLAEANDVSANEKKAQETPAFTQMGIVSPARQAQDRQFDEDESRSKVPTAETNFRAYMSLSTSARNLITELTSVDLGRCDRAMERASSRNQWKTTRAGLVLELREVFSEMVDTGADMDGEEVSKNF